MVEGVAGDASIPYIQLATGGYCITTLPGMEQFFEQTSGAASSSTDWEATTQAICCTFGFLEVF